MQGSHKHNSNKNKRFSWVKRLITPGMEPESLASTKPTVHFAKEHTPTRTPTFRPSLPKYRSEINTDSSSSVTPSTKHSKSLFNLNDITSIENDELVSYISSCGSMKMVHNQEHRFYANNPNLDNNDTFTMASITPIYGERSIESRNMVATSQSNSTDANSITPSLIPSAHSPALSSSLPTSLLQSYYNHHLQAGINNNINSHLDSTSILSSSTYDDNLSTRPLLSMSSDEEENAESHEDDEFRETITMSSITPIPPQDDSSTFGESKYPGSFISARSIRSTKSVRSTRSSKSSRSAVTSYSMITSPALTTINSASTAATSYTAHTSYTNAAATASSVITLASSSRHVGSSHQSFLS